MSDSEDDMFQVQPSNVHEIHQEIVRCKKNPETSGMFVSGWDDEDEDIEVVENPKDNPVDHVLWAAENDKVDTLKELLTSQPELVNVQDADGYTPLHRAAYSNHVNTVSYLLSLGANVNSKTELGWTPLHSACKWNNYHTAARLLAAGADPTALSDGGQSPMHLAAAVSHCKSTLLILLLRDESVEIAKMCNNSGDTPEELARGHGIYAPLFQMVIPAASYIRSIAFTCNPYVRAQQTSIGEHKLLDTQV